MYKTFICITAWMLVSLCGAAAQTITDPAFDLRFVPVQRTAAQLLVKLQIRASEGSAETGFNVGSGNFMFTHSASLTAPTLLSVYEFDKSTSIRYGGMTLTRPVAGVGSVNIEYLGEAGEGTGITREEWTDVCMIGFDVAAASPEPAAILWRPMPTIPTPAILFDDAHHWHQAGTLNGLGGVMLDARDPSAEKAQPLSMSVTASKGVALVSIVLPRGGSVVLKVYDAVGKERLNPVEAVPAQSGPYLYPMNIGDLRPGVYYLLAQTESGTVTRPFIVP